MDFFDSPVKWLSLCPFIFNCVSKLAACSVITCHIRKMLIDTCIRKDKTSGNTLEELYFSMSVVNLLSLIPSILDIIYVKNKLQPHWLCEITGFVQTFVDIAGLLLMTLVVHMISKLTWILTCNHCACKQQPLSLKILNTCIDIRFLLFLLAMLLSSVPIFISNISDIKGYDFIYSRCYIANDLVALGIYHSWLGMSCFYALINVICIPVNIYYSSYDATDEDTVQKVENVYRKSRMFPVFILIFSVSFYIHLFVKGVLKLDVDHNTDITWNTANVCFGHLFGLVPFYMYFQFGINNLIRKLCCCFKKKNDNETSDENNNNSSSISNRVRNSHRAHELVSFNKSSGTSVQTSGDNDGTESNQPQYEGCNVNDHEIAMDINVPVENRKKYTGCL